MPALTDSIEIALNWLGAIAGLGTLAYAIYNILRAQFRPTGYHTGAARRVLRTPYFVIATVLFVILGYILWKPLPIQLPWLLRFFITILGAGIFFPSLGLYIWGLCTLGDNFNASSGFGVRLNQTHRLITRGPYEYIRHPMYLAVILTGWGGLLLYCTWSMLFFAVMMLGLRYRGHKEEEALGVSFGAEWEAYKQHVPGWIPRFDHRFRKDDL